MPLEQLQFPFASLDFPGRTTLTVQEIAEKLGVSDRHVLDAIEENQFSALDLKGRDVSRRCVRIPIESYRDWIVATMTGPRRRELLCTLPRATLRELQRELHHLLSTQACA